jgi:hypothetical protein
MVSQLPIAHQTCYRAFRQHLEHLHTTIASGDPATLKIEADQVQAEFQNQILSLNLEDLEPAMAHHVQSYQVEIHKQLRLLATDLSFLQAARKPATLEQRRQQGRDRVETLIRYCEAVVGGRGSGG